MDTINKLSDFEWGGRVRPRWQFKVVKIAREINTSPTTSFSGNMVSSSETTYWPFLDGGVRVTTGPLKNASGTFVTGEKSRAYILYRLGADPKLLLKKMSLPELDELQRELTDT